MQPIVGDFVALSLYDAVKAKGMPKTDKFIENGIVAVGYESVVKGILDGLLKPFMGFIAEDKYKTMVTKFIGQGATIVAVRMALGYDGTVSDAFLKQLIAQAATEMYAVTMQAKIL